MKRLLGFILLASAMPALFSCTKENDLSPEPEMREVVITATREDAEPGTKTEIVDGTTYWSVGDKISVFFGSGTNGGAKFTSLNTEPSASADFIGNLTAVTGSENGSSSRKYFWGVYPYSENNSVTLSGNSNYLTTVVSDVQYGAPDSFSAGQNIWIGRDTGLELSFKSLLSGIKFSFSRSDITRVTIQGNNGETLAGKVNVTMDSGVPIVSSVVEGKTVLTLVPENGDTFQTGVVYRALFLPTNFTQGLTVTFCASDGTAGRRTYGNLNFERNKPKSATNADAGLTWEAWVDTSEYVAMGVNFYWASKNIGADSPEDYGDYFAWGEVSPRNTFSWDNYKWGTKTSFSKYVTDSSLGTVDNLTTLQPEDDAATVNLGENWRTPTREEWIWLNENCDWVLTSLSGINGYLVTSKVPGYEGKRIFLPAGGNIYADSQSVGEEGAYWSSTLDADSNGAYFYYLNTDPERSYHMLSDEWRYPGLSVRAVYNFDCGYVEMGDGLKWATMNLGATEPWEVGDEFSWGETVPKESAKQENYAFYDPDETTTNCYGHSYSKYNSIDGKTILDPEDDAAAVNWRGSWRMPTMDEWERLAENCEIDEIDDYQGSGVSGLLFTSKVPGYEGNELFLPANSLWWGIVDENDNWPCGFYWSSTLNSSYESEYYHWADENDLGFEHLPHFRYQVSAIRPVSD